MKQTEDFRIHNVRDPGDNAMKQRAVARWLEDGVLASEQAERRVDQLLMVATHVESDQVAGMTTTYLDTPARFGVPLWVYRTYVALAFRRHDVALHMLLESLAFHRRRFESGDDTRGLGVYMEIENPIIKRHRNEAMWSRSRMAFVGCNERGDHCRVAWFEGARLDRDS